ncbi:MAG TPA: hypothetical protein VF096_04970 [Azonexus sp.]
MMDGMGNMMLGMSLFGWLVLLAVVLVMAAAVKYLLFDRKRDRDTRPD